MAKLTRNEAGEWREGSASPKLLPEHLRKLPGDLVAADVDDPDKAHDLDAPHVVRSLMRDYADKHIAPKPEKKTAKNALKKLRAPGPGERAPVTQWYVDVARMRVIATLINKAVDEFNAGINPDLECPFYLWFPTPNVNEYVLRKGLPPPNRQRPKHLRNIDLRVDMLDPPRSMRRLMKEAGVDFEVDVMARLKQAEAANRVILL